MSGVSVIMIVLNASRWAVEEVVTNTLLGVQSGFFLKGRGPFDGCLQNESLSIWVCMRAPDFGNSEVGFWVYARLDSIYLDPKSMA